MPALTTYFQRLALLVILFLGLSGNLALAADDPGLPTAAIARLKGHAETVYAVAFSPDGRYVLTGSFDKTLKLWDAVTGKEIKTFSGPAAHQNLILSVAFSPDGRLLASGASDNTAKIWETPLDRPLRTFAQAAGVNAVALSPDGTRLAGAGRDGAIKIWNTADGKQLFNLTGHTGPITGVSFSGNGQLLASSGSDRTMRLWNLTNGQAIGTVEAHATPVRAVVLAPGANAAYTAAEDGTLKCWALPILAPRNLPTHGDAVTSVAISPDGQWVVTGSTDKTVRLSNFDNGQQIRAFTGPTTAVSAVAISPNHATIAAGFVDGQLFCWNAADGKLVSQRKALVGAISGIAFLPQNTQVLSAGNDGHVKLWSVMPAKKPGQLEEPPVKDLQVHPAGATSIALHGNGSQLLSGGVDKSIKLWDLATGKAVKTYGPLSDAVTAVALSRDNSQVAAYAGKVVRIWNLADLKEIATLQHPAPVTCVSFNPDRSRVVTGAEDHLARIWELGTGKELQAFRQGGSIRGVAFRDDATIISASADKTTVVNRLALARLVQAAQGPVNGLALTPDGSHILTVSADKTAKLWDLGNGSLVRSFTGAEGSLEAAAVSRNSALVAVGGADKTVRLYTFGDAKDVGKLAAAAAVQSLTFSADNQRLAVGCADGMVRTWWVQYPPQNQPGQPGFGEPGQSFTHKGSVTGVAFAPDNKTAYSGSLDATLQAWHPASNMPVQNFGHGNLVDAVAFNPAGTLLAAGSHDGTVRIWDVVKGPQVRQINAHTTPAASPVYCLAWNPDGKQIVSGSLDRTLKLWDAGNGSLVREFKAYKPKEFEKGHQDGVFCAAFSLDGRFLASGGSDHTIKIWDVATGEVVRELVNPSIKAVELPGAVRPAHPGWVYSLHFTPNGTRLVSVGSAPRNRGYLGVWNVTDGRLLHGEEYQLGPFYSVALSPDGQRLALACGPYGRGIQEANAYILKMPSAEKAQASRASK
jgi:WD40 repeat protein